MGLWTNLERDKEVATGAFNYSYGDLAAHLNHVIVDLDFFSFLIKKEFFFTNSLFLLIT